MRLCNETITVINAKYDQSTGYDTYNPTIINGVSWFCEIASNVESSGLKAADKFTIRIPEDANFNGKTYLDPITYAQSGDPSKNFTLKNGDIIVRAAVSGGSITPSGLKQLYTDVVTILGVTNNMRAPKGKHWKVVGT